MEFCGGNGIRQTTCKQSGTSSVNFLRAGCSFWQLTRYNVKELMAVSATVITTKELYSKRKMKRKVVDWILCNCDLRTFRACVLCMQCWVVGVQVRAVLLVGCVRPSTTVERLTACTMRTLRTTMSDGLVCLSQLTTAPWYVSRLAQCTVHA